MHSCLLRPALKLKPHAAVLKIMMTAMATYPTFLAMAATSWYRCLSSGSRTILFRSSERRRKGHLSYDTKTSAFHEPIASSLLYNGC